MNKLPDDCLIEIAQLLDIRSFAHLVLANKPTNKLLTDHDILRRIYKIPADKEVLLQIMLKNKFLSNLGNDLYTCKSSVSQTFNKFVIIGKYDKNSNDPSLFNFGLSNDPRQKGLIGQQNHFVCKGISVTIWLISKSDKNMLHTAEIYNNNFFIKQIIINDEYYFTIKIICDVNNKLITFDINNMKAEIRYNFKKEKLLFPAFKYSGGFKFVSFNLL